MPINKKGKKILRAMSKQYGAKKGKSVFYASINSGKIKGVEGLLHKAKRKAKKKKR